MKITMWLTDISRWLQSLDLFNFPVEFLRLMEPASSRFKLRVRIIRMIAVRHSAMLCKWIIRYDLIQNWHKNHRNSCLFICNYCSICTRRKQFFQHMIEFYTQGLFFNYQNGRQKVFYLESIFQRFSAFQMSMKKWQWYPNQWICSECLKVFLII
jgi:hypothetical protein